ncbi:hypothetical protein B0H11DRAFT_317723 [Mycena galericulata]|nr:hypothetical protein B0H11DRAFT_317723 [Mycena galericulata]
MRHPTASTPPVVKIARYLPPRNPIDSEMGIVDATTLTLLHKMMADSYEHGRIIWADNKARCALTGEVDPDNLPCGPNPAQKRVEEWLISARLLDPDDEDESMDGTDEEEITPPQSPSTPETASPLPWHRRLEIVTSRKGNPKSASEPSLRSPRSPLSPSKLWSSVQRGASAIPTVRVKPKHPPSEPSTPVATPPRQKCVSLGGAPLAGPSSRKAPSWDGSETILATAFKRAAILGTITDDDAEAIMRRHRHPLPPSLPDATWYIPPIESQPDAAPKKFSAPPKPTSRPEFEDPASYRWPAPAPPPPFSPPTEFPTPRDENSDSDPCPDLRWYHPFLFLFFWHFFIVAFSAYVILRLVVKPMIFLAVLYYACLLFDVLYSFL